MINPAWLKTFKTLVEVGHFTQTANQLFMTQPGVSQHIKKLEEVCGHMLLRREGKSFELTIQGSKVYQYALHVEKEEKNLLESLSFDDPNSGECRLACSGAMALKIYPKIVHLQTRVPNLSVTLEAAPNHRILEDIENSAVDLGIVTDQPNSKQYTTTIVGQEVLCLVLPESYRDEVVTSDLLKKCGLINHPDARHYLSLYLENNEAYKGLNLEKIPVRGYINQLSQILEPIKQGIGFTVLPYSAIESYYAKAELYVVQNLQPVTETLYLVQKRNRILPKRFESIIESLPSWIGEV